MKTPVARSTSFEQVLSKFISAMGPQTIKVLDIGGGTGFFWKNILQENPNVILEIVDPFNIGELRDYANQRMTGTWGEILPQLDDESFDLVTAIDVVEHMDVQSAYLMMYQMQRLSKGHIAIYTPNGFLWQPPSTNNPFNAHVSGWNVGDLKNFGFNTIRGHVGWKPLFGPYSLRKDKLFLPIFSWPLIAISFLISTLSPRHAFAISGWMRCNETHGHAQDR
jgi:hypothetical protein